MSARPLSDWHEDLGPMLWWKFPIEEPPYVGSPRDDDWPEYHTHFTAIEVPDEPSEDDRADTVRELGEAVGLLRLVTTQCPNCDENRRVECSDECVSIPANIMKSLAWLAGYDQRRRAK